MNSYESVSASNNRSLEDSDPKDSPASSLSPRKGNSEGEAVSALASIALGATGGGDCLAAIRLCEEAAEWLRDRQRNQWDQRVKAQVCLSLSYYVAQYGKGRFLITL